MYETELDKVRNIYINDLEEEVERLKELVERLERQIEIEKLPKTGDEE